MPREKSKRLTPQGPEYRIDRAAPRPGELVLDVACGTGVVSRLAAERMGSGRVVGLDINAGMLAVARSLNSPSIEWYEGSALAA